MKSKHIEFTLPENCELPEGGDKEFDMVCSFKAIGGRAVVMTKFGDCTLPEYNGEDGEHRPDYGNMAQGIAHSMGEAMSPGETVGAPAANSY